jgi:hypothetical protein
MIFFMVHPYGSAVATTTTAAVRVCLQSKIYLNGEWVNVMRITKVTVG